jgi:hypothetical protein
LDVENDAELQRRFVLYWVGFVVLVASGVSILLILSGLLVDVLSYGCWYPMLSPMLGISRPPEVPQTAIIPFYCASPAVPIVRFVFRFFSALVVGGAGAYMMLNGKPR